MTSICFEVPGPPVPWQRAGRTKSGRTFKPAKTSQYQALMRAAFLSALGGRPWPLDGARYQVLMFLTFADARRRDLDNCLKQIDSLNGVAWIDDSQVDDIRAERLPPKRDDPGMIVKITRMSTPSPARARAKPSQSRAASEA